MRDELYQAERAAEDARARMKQMDDLAAILKDLVSSTGFDIERYDGSDLCSSAGKGISVLLYHEHY
jgi:hypothetical protein